MDCELSGPLMNYVFVLMLLGVHWSPVFPAPTHTSCDNELKKAELLTALLGHEADKVLNEYTKNHRPRTDSIPHDVPESTVSGINVSEKLQDIYVKNGLFYLHMSQIEKYQSELLHNPEPILNHLSMLKKRLIHHSHSIKATFIHIDLQVPVLTTAAPPQLSHVDSYVKKVYGWGVLVRMKEWVLQVQQVLMEAKQECDKNTTGIQLLSRGTPSI